jgi:hypothetical protein
MILLENADARIYFFKRQEHTKYYTIKLTFIHEINRQFIASRIPESGWWWVDISNDQGPMGSYSPYHIITFKEKGHTASRCSECGYREKAIRAVPNIPPVLQTFDSYPVVVQNTLE